MTTERTAKIMQTRDGLIDTVKYVRSTFPESKMDEIVNPLEAAVYALGKILTNNT